MRMTAGSPRPGATHGQRAVGKHDHADAIIVGNHDFGKTRRDVGIQAEPIEPARPHSAEAARVDRNEYIEVLVFAEFPSHELPRARGRLPIDPRQGIALDIPAQLMQLRSRTDTRRGRDPVGIAARTHCALSA